MWPNQLDMTRKPSHLVFFLISAVLFQFKELCWWGGVSHSFNQSAETCHLLILLYKEVNEKSHFKRQSNTYLTRFLDNWDRMDGFLLIYIFNHLAYAVLKSSQVPIQTLLPLFFSLSYFKITLVYSTFLASPNSPVFLLSIPTFSTLAF